MESPKRKLQKQNDYQRHKLFRKIKRRNKALAEQEQEVATKLLKKKLKLPKFDTGDDVRYVPLYDIVGLDPETGQTILNTGERVNRRLPEVTVSPRDSFKITPEERNAEARLLRSEMGDAAYEEYMDRLKTLRAIKSASVPQDLSVYGYIADGIDGLMTGVSMIPGPLSLAGDEYWALRGAKQLSQGDAMGILGMAPVIGKAAPEMARTAKALYNSLPNYPLMFSRAIDKRRIANAINQGVESFDGTIPVLNSNNNQIFVTPRLQLKEPTYLVYTWAKHKVPEIINDDGSVNIKNLLNVQIKGADISENNKFRDNVKNIFGQYAKLNIDPYSDINLASKDVDLGYWDLVNLSIENTRVIDKNGDLNIRALLHLKRQVEQNYGKSYKDLIKQLVGHDPINIHSKAVYDTAKSSPTPSGFTRLQYLEAALLHDIGKFGGDYKHHAKAGVDLLKDLHYPADLDVMNSIRNHMYADLMLDLDPLTRGVHFADVARGLDYQDAAFRYPLLLYPRQLPLRKPVTASTRDLLKNYINPILKREGYNTIPLDVSDEEAQRLVDEAIALHRSFLRGVRDPHKAAGMQEDIRNSINALAGAMEAFGENTPQSRLDYSLLYAPKLPTGSGRSDLFRVSHTSNPSHHSTKFSRNMGIDPNTKDGVYVSTSEEILNNYATSTDSRPGERAIVQLPRIGKSGDSSLAEQLEKNDWELYPAERVRNDKPPIGVYSMYEKPYRLQTGRSLQQDLIAEDPNVPKLKFGNLQEAPVVNSEDYFGEYPSFELVDKINKELELSGTNIRVLLKGLAEDEYGTISGTPTIADLESYKNLAKKINNYDGNNLVFEEMYRVYKRNFKDLKELKIKVGTKVNSIDNAKLSEKGYIIDTSQNPFSGSFETDIHDINGSVIAYGSDGIITNVNKVLPTQGNLSDKLYKVFKINVIKGKFDEAEKFIPSKSAFIKSAAKLYVEDIMAKRRKVNIKSLQERNLYLHDPRRLDDFVRSKGVVPRYEQESFNSNIVGAADGLYPKNNVTKNGKIREHKLFVIGDKGKKVLEKRKEITGKNLVSKHRDAGTHTRLYKVTRKSAQ